MNMSLFLLIVAISFVAILFYFIGGRKNRKRFKEIADELGKNSCGSFAIYYKSKECKAFAEKRIYLFVALKNKEWSGKLGDIILLLKNYFL
ncbi:MAG: hypothetical protein GWP03_04160 [Proteobacteria bacterium]|nr:hypothetical protein [Pseudomonadota bacterium]